MKRIRKTVNVSKRDIAEGCRHDGDNCPVARAVARVTGEQVTVSTIDVGIKRRCLQYYPLPPKARRFVADFDRGYPVKSFGFTFFYEG